MNRPYSQAKSANPRTKCEYPSAEDGQSQLVAWTHLSLQSEKMMDGGAAVTKATSGRRGRRPLPYHFSLFSLHSSLFSLLSSPTGEIKIFVFSHKFSILF